MTWQDYTPLHPADRAAPAGRLAVRAPVTKVWLALPQTVELPTDTLGLDEVGRGAFAGPLVAAAVMLPADVQRQLGEHALLLRDSKTLNRMERELMAERIAELAQTVRTVTVSTAEINEHGVGWANREAFRRLIEAIEAPAYVVDGRVAPPVSAARASRLLVLPRADATVRAVAAASIVAKVYRDRLMRELHERWPLYGWARNVGYGTPQHITAIEQHGTTPEHRTAFVRTALLRRAIQRQQTTGGCYQQASLAPEQTAARPGPGRDE